MNFRRMRVEEIMTVNPVTCDPKDTVENAATLMKEHDVGSLLVVKEGKPEGIITERDIITKIVAQGRSPADAVVEEIMSKPVVSVSPSADITTAARLMADRRIRRLPVVSGDMLVGLVTQRDVLKVSPRLFETLDHLRGFAYEPPRSEMEMAGYCEVCGSYSPRLTEVNGRLVCPTCARETG
ncbi:MAG: CBS domain-containing protein [Thermoplasmata archaeon]|nr:CBS domain-containing protein [Thermoplasmata archaeon]